ncbi:MAG: hypothetical protein AAF580_04570 [Pseudomonadota bacterium]
MAEPQSRLVGFATPAALSGAGIIDLRGATLTLFAPVGEPQRAASIWADGEVLARGVELRRANALAGINQIVDAGFEGGCGRWSVRAERRYGITLTPDDVGSGEGAAVLRVPAPKLSPVKVVYSCPVHGVELPVVGGGDTWVAHMRMALSRCDAALTLTALDGAGQSVRGEATAVEPAGTHDGRDVFVSVQPSSEARFITVSLAVKPREADAFARFSRPQLVLSDRRRAPAFALAPYSARVMATLRQVGGEVLTASVDLPREVLDGAAHEIAVVEDGTGQHFANSPMRVAGSP